MLQAQSSVDTVRASLNLNFAEIFKAVKIIQVHQVIFSFAAENREPLQMLEPRSKHRRDAELLNSHGVHVADRLVRMEQTIQVLHFLSHK